MKVERMMFTILNWVPVIAMSPRMIIQLMAIGVNVISVNSMRPYEISRAKNMRKEEM